MEAVRFNEGFGALVAGLRVRRGQRGRCGVCGRHCSFYDWSTLGQAERRAYLPGRPFRQEHRELRTLAADRYLCRPQSPAHPQWSLPAHGGSPAHYERDNPEQTQALLLGLLASSRSVNAAKAALRRIDLSGSEEDIESVAADLIEELELRNTRPLDPDSLALFIDAKYLEVRDGGPCGPAASTRPSTCSATRRSALSLAPFASSARTWGTGRSCCAA